MPDADRVADAKNQLRLATSLTLRAIASVDRRVREAPSRLWRRTALPSRSDVRALRSSITHLTRAVRDLDRS